jgi:hypothetical protein
MLLLVVLEIFSHTIEKLLLTKISSSQLIMFLIINLDRKAHAVDKCSFT